MTGTLSPAQNRILAALPKKEQRRLSEELEPVQLGVKDVLFDVSEPISYVYFPVTGVMSLVTTMNDGRVFEFATVGNEGMVGLPVLLGATSVPAKAFAQIPGLTLRLRASKMRAEQERGGPLIAVLHRYAQALFNQVAQTVSCNRAHTITQRCARWLLMTHDRVSADQFPLTQEFLADMLGVRRATANKTAIELQNGGAITYARGKIRILQRRRLERLSCECYQSIKDEFERLLPQRS